MKGLKSTNKSINFTRHFFHMSQNFCHTVKKKAVEKRQKRE